MTAPAPPARHAPGMPFRDLLHELRESRRVLCADPDLGRVPCEDVHVYVRGYLHCLAIERPAE